MLYKIIDNWYDNPDEVRQSAINALKKDCRDGEKHKKLGTRIGFYPGFRTKCSLDNCIWNLKKFESVLDDYVDRTTWIHEVSVDVMNEETLSSNNAFGDKVEFDFRYMSPKIIGEDDLLLNVGTHISNCSFQYIPEKSNTWPHADANTSMAGVIYLHPDPPKGTGTGFYRRKSNNTTRSSGEEIISADELLDPDAWEMYDYIENVYNRCIIYEGKNYHTATKFFGSTPDDSRLTQVFFFNTYKNKSEKPSPKETDSFFGFHVIPANYV